MNSLRQADLISDAKGQVAGIERPSGATSELEYDAIGQLVAVRHSDGTAQSFQYDANGRLLEAANDDVTLTWERDALGRVLQESSGEHWVRSTWDRRGLRRAMSSSLGARQVFERDAMGRVVAQRYKDMRSNGLDDPAAANPTATNSATTNTTAPNPEDPTDTKPDDWVTKIKRDLLGLEIARELPGGVQSRWLRDKLGRPVQHQLWDGRQVTRDQRYRWGYDNRLLESHDVLRGTATTYEHDALGQLVGARHSDGRFDIRMPNALGELFRRQDRGDRQYAPGGELMRVATRTGVREYSYDEDGRMVEKREPTGERWEYHWGVDGSLREVVRPDGETVTFKYDALGRRIEKRFKGVVTHWVWDGNNPLHEWSEDTSAPAETNDSPSTAPQSGPRSTDVHQVGHPPTGPPPAPELTTWLFDEGSFFPAAKIVGERRYSIITDLQGTPVAMHDERGVTQWTAELSLYGEVQAQHGERGACPFRFQGQYEDAETGLYYNRFRYYDPEAGVYVSPDPIGLAGGLAAYAYVHDPTTWVDPFGLAKTECDSAAEGGAGGETLLPDSYWINKKAPTQVTPGTRTVNQTSKPSSKGGTYHSTTHCDEYGRQIGQTHRTHHGYSNPKSEHYHPNPHHHRRNPVTGEKLKNPRTGSRTWPGLFGN